MAAATTTRTASARSAGRDIPARRAAVVAAISSLDAERCPPELRVLVEIGPQGDADEEGLREAHQVGVLERRLRRRRDATGGRDGLLPVGRREPLHEELR